MQDQQAIDAMSFEEAMAELEKTVNQLESGDTRLDDSISLFEYGSKLKKRCETTLNSAQEKINTIMLDADGEPAGLSDEAPF